MLNITIDAGHGQFENQSPRDSSFFEGTNNYYFALALKRELEKYEDVVVHLTREKITDNPSLEKRGKLAVNNNSDVFLSVHSNASSSSSAYGVEGYYSVKTPAAYSLLASLCHAVSDSLPVPKVRRVVTKTSGGKDYYAVLRGSEGVPYSMLIEMGFHTNTKELGCIRLNEWHDAVAQKQAAVFADFFKLQKKVDRQYSVVIKTFKSEQDAETFLSALKDVLSNAEIVEGP